MPLRRVLPLLLACLSASAAEPSLMRYVHPDANALIGVDVRKLLDQELGDALGKEMRASGLPLESVLPLLNGVERVLISGVAQASTPGATKKQVPMVVTITGHFPLAQLRELAASQKATIRPFRFAELVTPLNAKPSDMHVALVNSETILLGDRTALAHALEQAQAGAARRAAAPLIARAATYASAYDVWFVGSAPEAALAGQALPPQAGMLQEVESIGLGIVMRDGMTMALEVDAKSEQGAQALAGMAQMMSAMGAVSARKQADTPNLDFLQKVSFTTQGKTVRASLTLSKAELDEAMASIRKSVPGKLGVQLASRKPKTAPAARTTPPPAASATPPMQPVPEPAPSAPKVIRIYGLSEGVREIPLGPRQP